MERPIHLTKYIKVLGYRLFFIVGILFLLNGCAIGAIGMVAKNARGGQSDVFITAPVHNLQPYQNLDLVPLTNGIGQQLSPELLQYLNDQILIQVTDNGGKLNEEKALRVSGKVIHIIDEMLDNQILVQVAFRDPSTGQSLGEVNITGQAGGFRGLKSAADGVAGGLVTLLAKNHFPTIEEPSWF